MSQGKLSLLAFLLFIGVASYALFFSDEANKQDSERHPPVRTSTHHDIQTPAPLLGNASSTPSKPTASTPTHASTTDQLPEQASEQPSEKAVNHTEIPAIHELAVIPMSPILCNIGMKVPLIALNVSLQDLKFDNVNQYTKWHTTEEKIATVTNHELHCMSAGNTKLVATVGDRCNAPLGLL